MAWSYCTGDNFVLFYVGQQNLIRCVCEDEKVFKGFKWDRNNDKHCPYMAGIQSGVSQTNSWAIHKLTPKESIMTAFKMKGNVTDF